MHIVIETILIGIGSGVIASIIFFFMLYAIRPKFKISPEITYDEVNGKKIYYIKVINKTRKYLNNIKYELCIIKHESTGSNDGVGILKNYEKINFLKEPIHIMYPYSMDKENSDYANRFSTDVDLEQKLIEAGPSSYLYFTFYAEHSFSNRGKIKIRKYAIAHLKRGSFICGNTFDIIKR